MYNFSLKHSEEWSKKYPGKYLAIVGREIAGISTSGHEAFKKAKAKYPKKKVYITYMPTSDEANYLI